MNATLYYAARVRDSYVGIKGKYEESCVSSSMQERDGWLKEWGGMYDKDSGYKVERKDFDSYEAAALWAGY